MKINVVEEEKNKLVIELENKGHAFCNVLRDELNKDDHVKIAAYKLEHPLIRKPKLMVETDSKEDPKKAVAEAIKRLKKELTKFRKEFAKIK